MSPSRFACSLLLALTLSVSATGQKRRPNLSGTWELALAKSDFGKLPPPEGVTNVIEHREPNLVVRSTMKIKQGEFSAEDRYTTDGQENINKTTTTLMTSRTRWVGDELVIEAEMEFQGRKVQFTERWKLSEAGRTLTTHRVMKTPSGDVPQRLVFSKKPARATKAGKTAKAPAAQPATPLR